MLHTVRDGTIIDPEVTDVLEEDAMPVIEGYRAIVDRNVGRGQCLNSVLAVVGDGNGHIGLGYGKAGETLPAKEKAIRKAKLNLTKIPRGCASYDCSCSEPHSLPIAIEGKCSSVRVKLIPAPQGTGLVVGNELKKILKAVGVKDIYSKTSGKVKTTFNTAKACMQALNKLNNLEM